MNPRSWRLRLSFRSRLALVITGVFVLSGAALLAIMYFLVAGLFDGALGTEGLTPPVTVSQEFGVGVQAAPVTAAVPDDLLVRRDAIVDSRFPTDSAISIVNVAPGQMLGGGMAVNGDIAFNASGVMLVNASSPAARAITTWYTGKSEVLASDVLTGLLIWSGVALVVFALLAALVAWWLARRAMRRIGEVTKMAQDLSTHDLHRRLDLPGPADEIKELGDTIDAMLNRLEAAFASQDRFIANASHELRTPLTTARTALEIPLAQGRVPADLEPALRTALRAGGRTELLINSLLSMARGTAVLESEAVEVAGIVYRAVMEAEGSCVTQDLELEPFDLDLVTDPIFVVGDQTMIEQACANLVDNAVRHNHSKGFVQLKVWQEGPECVIEVENSGSVIDAEELALLPEPFYRAGKSRIASSGEPGRGVGLGLSIVQRIAETHGGQMILLARPEGGLKVELRLPVA